MVSTIGVGGFRVVHKVKHILRPFLKCMRPGVANKVSKCKRRNRKKKSRKEDLFCLLFSLTGVQRLLKPGFLHLHHRCGDRTKQYLLLVAPDGGSRHPRHSLPWFWFSW